MKFHKTKTYRDKVREERRGDPKLVAIRKDRWWARSLKPKKKII